MGAKKSSGRRPARRASPEGRAAGILRRLDALGRALLREELRGQAPAGPPGSVTLTVEVDLGGGNGAERARRLVRELRREVQAVGDGLVPLRPGRVYCFWCRTSGCPHAAPPGPRDVFFGYDPTGRPRFNDFADLALARSDPRIEDVYRDPPDPIAIPTTGQALRADQLPGFGGDSGVWRILYQVAIGYLSPADPRPGRRDLFALTLQAVATRGRAGPQLELNVLGEIPGEGRERWLQRAYEGELARSLRRARRRLRELAAGEGVEQEEAVGPVLAEVARTLQRLHRQAHRRTRHARARRRQGDRPTAKALEDARRAVPGEVFYDEERGTYVAVGPRGRTHVFSPEGRHVTSLVVSRQAVGRKLKLRQWRELRAEEVAAFRALLGA